MEEIVHLREVVRKGKARAQGEQRDMAVRVFRERGKASEEKDLGERQAARDMAARDTAEVKDPCSS